VSRVRGAAAALIVLATGIPAGVAVADSFTPVRLDIGVAAVARLHHQLAVTVHVTADPGALDNRTAPVRIGVKLASECGGDFQHTDGVVLLNRRLSPQPTTGRAYSALARGSGKPAAYGTDVVCTYLEEEGDDRVFANDESVTTDVSKACTVAAARYDHLRLARGARRHRARIGAARRAARRACGPGVPL
jgi:hypothetical protein